MTCLKPSIYSFIFMSNMTSTLTSGQMPMMNILEFYYKINNSTFSASIRPVAVISKGRSFSTQWRTKAFKKYKDKGALCSSTARASSNIPVPLLSGLHPDWGAVPGKHSTFQMSAVCIRPRQDQTCDSLSPGSAHPNSWASTNCQQSLTVRANDTFQPSGGPFF